jgi:hypothetical protein
LNFEIKERQQLEDGTERFLIRVKKDELVYLGYFLESFEGWCNYTTPDKNQSILQVDVTHDYVKYFDDLIDALKKWELCMK